MAVAISKPATHTYESTFEKQEFEGSSSNLITVTVTIKHTASFNGKVYNGKRYINDSYRANNTNSGVKTRTHVWQDGMGWIEGGNSELVKLFNLK